MLPPFHPSPPPSSYGRVELKERAPLLEALPHLFSGGGVRAEAPNIMEEYGQRWVTWWLV